jgi:predicted nucleotidyltransferase component of viral defense system
MPNNKKSLAPEAIFQMLKRYELNSINDYKNAIKEIVQEIALLGLWRAKFFEKAAFYGGTALRILYKLDRFSENLDFSLLKPKKNFDLSKYEKAIKDELESFGFTAIVEKKKKTKQSPINSAFIKLNTIEHMLLIGLPKGFDKSIHPEELIKIRLEVDTDPPKDGGITENSILLLPYPFSIKTFQIEDLFAGKVHAVLCREWKGRVKGRDWYDLIWFISRNVSLNLEYLRQRMIQSNYWDKNQKMTKDQLLNIFDKKISSLDIKSAKNDIINFIKDPSIIELWSKDFFKIIVRKINISYLY